MTEPTRFEDRHRELREALSATVAGTPDEELAAFDRWVSKLVDDLVAAVREERRLLPRTITTLGTFGLEHDAAIEAVEKALAALDEASRG